MEINDSSKDICTRLASVDWDFDVTSEREPIYDIHPYPAKFIPQIPREIIRLFHPRDNSIILDPFCGSGTSLVEAVRAGVPATGIDLHPLAILITKVKTTPLKVLVTPIANAISKQAINDNLPIPAIPRIDHWFNPDVQQALANLTIHIQRVADDDVRDILKVALSRIIVRVSNQESDTRYAAVQKNVDGEQVYTLFASSVSFIERALVQAYGGLCAERIKCSLLNENVLEVTSNKIDRNVGLVVTSPPYPNAYEYWLYHKYRMYWMGMDPLKVREAEIGARPNYFKKNPATEADFQRQMSQVFRLLTQVMKTGALACFIVGRSLVHGHIIDNGAVLERAALPNGFRRVAQVERVIKRNKKAFNPTVSNINTESIILFQLENDMPCQI
ncbi:MAG: DNA methyltransferase [Dehalococcoidia bacterium]